MIFHGGHLGFQDGGHFAADPVVISPGASNIGNQCPKLPLYAKFQCHMSHKTHENDFQWFFTAAILDFKMAADPLVRSLGAGYIWNQRPKLRLYAKFQCHSSCKIWENDFIEISWRPSWISRWRPFCSRPGRYIAGGRQYWKSVPQITPVCEISVPHVT